MPVHITMLYAALLALLYLTLTFRTIVLRGRVGVSLGDGGSQALQRAIRAHANCSEYVPLAIVLLLLVEAAGARPVVVHALGCALLLGRVLHALGVSRLREPLVLRMSGMVLTTGCLIVGSAYLLVASLAHFTQQGTTPMNRAQLSDFARRYAAAWSSGDPGKLAAFYAEDGSLSVNAGAPSVGRAAITTTAKGFMTAFPDMLVKLDGIEGDGRHAIFQWIWTGTNTGPGGTGRHVRLQGYEDWTLGSNGLIRESKGHYDEAEYRRQLQAGPELSQ